MNTAVKPNLDQNDETSLSHEAARLRGVADELENQADSLRRENDAEATRPTGAASAHRKGNAMRITKKVVGWTLGVGVVALVGAVVYGKLQAMGVEPSDVGGGAL